MRASRFRQACSGVMVGCLCAVSSPAHLYLNHLSFPALPALADSCVEVGPEQPGLTINPGPTNIGGVQANISYNSTNLTINCEDNSYSVAMFSGPSGGPDCNDGYAQVGWLKSASSAPAFFDYTQLKGGKQGCGALDFPDPQSINASHTYKTVVANVSCTQSLPYLIYYYLDGSLLDSQCSDWGADQVQKAL